MVDAELAALLTDDVIRGIVALVPDVWLPAPAAESRAAYATYLAERLAAPRPFIEEAGHGRP